LKVKVIESFHGKQFIGKYVKNPATEDDVLILPADFVDPKNATGVVMSVPGHAPYDFVALKNIKKNVSILRKYNLTSEILEAIKPISIISVPDYSELPASFVVEKMNIQNQSDPKLEKATKEVYRHEFHNGKMRHNTGKYSGLSVAKAKDRVKEEFLLKNEAEVMYELLNQQVFCRCGTKCVVKIFKDQWFIDYGRSEWKALAHKNLDKIEILPEELRAEFNYVIDWLHEKACARKSGLGTKLPWDSEWIIESLSDSTIYMAYYIIAKYINEQKIQANHLTDEFFDYIFLGIGNTTKISKKIDLSNVILEQMHKEFNYFYPLDSRHSGRDLVSNHLTFMIFNHTAIYPEDLWPRQIVTNGSVMMDGVKMSKSFGNIIPLREALPLFGADPLRLSVLTTAELLQDAEFSPSIAKSMLEKLERLYNFTKGTFSTKYGKNFSKGLLTTIDKWMLSRLQVHIKKTTEAMDQLSIRKAIQTVLYDLDQDFQWYKKQAKNQKEKKARKSVIFNIFKEVIEAQIKMLAPAAPYITEELWELMGKKGFIAQSSWPIVDETKIDILIEEKVTLIINVLKDTLKIIQATDILPKKIYYYVATPWKWKTYLNILKTSVLTKPSQQDLMKILMKYPDLKAKARNVSKFVSQMILVINKLHAEKKERLLQVGIINESKVITEFLGTLEKNLKSKVYLFSEDNSERYDPKDKAKTARPYRPAIYIE
jgi:leucyl-tRNA synthetase